MTAGTLRVGALIDRAVADAAGSHHGVVLDVRVVQDGPVGPGGDAALRVEGLVVGRGRGIERLGLFRHVVHGPALLKAIDRWGARHRRFLAWDQLVDPVADVADGGPLRFSGGVRPLPDGW
ncbi:hypothetical protein [Dermatobacter hominis]|uniref:hypothetical protein n=1 Tax=Dermatobacter hominis TaxID=2884263 RepID=UPI001D0FC72C|nr:hypothetical protein [Dermatobacter hominis]UDY37472.1 hypothetical protein LH044_07990 [Dermatobacter hominis]